jgi:hypothetical protein
MKTREEHLAVCAAYRANNPQKRQDTIRKSRHGIDATRYWAEFVFQHGVCAICLNPPKEGTKLHIDHDHACCPGTEKACGKCFRGLLCGNCNRMLGLAKDDPQLLENARYYLGARD